MYTNNWLSKRKMKEIILFTIASKIIEYLGIKLTKKVKEPYTENYKTMMKEIEKDTNRKIACAHGLK